MTCVGRSCSNPTLFDIQTHGMSVGLCATHAKPVMKHVGLQPTDAVNDWVKLWAVLNSRELFYKLMKLFTNEVSRAEKKRQKKATWYSRDQIAIHLTYSLSRYEGLCWFGEQQKIMSGLLTAAEFKNAIVNGFMVKDPGPGADHGEYSHRLQWHYIMRVMTDDFSQPKTPDWSMTPLELYSQTLANANFDAGTGNMWGTLLEGNQNSGVLACPGDPAWVNRQFREHEVLKASSFGATLTRRYDKRVGLEAKAQTLLEERGYKVDTSPTGKLATGKDVKLHGVLEYVYKWKKAGRMDAAKVPAALGGESKEQEAAERLWADVFKNKYTGSKQEFRRAAYVDPDDDTLVVISDGLLLHGSESVVDAPLGERITSSRGGLNPAFKYCSSLGAKRT